MLLLDKNILTIVRKITFSQKIYEEIVISPLREKETEVNQQTHGTNRIGTQTSVCQSQCLSLCYTGPVNIHLRQRKYGSVRKR